MKNLSLHLGHFLWPFVHSFTCGGRAEQSQLQQRQRGGRRGGSGGSAAAGESRCACTATGPCEPDGTATVPWPAGTRERALALAARALALAWTCGWPGRALLVLLRVHAGCQLRLCRHGAAPAFMWMAHHLPAACLN